MHPDLFTIPGINLTIPSYGAMVLLAFLSGTWWMTRRVRRVKADPDVVLNIALISLISGFFGARIFYIIHYWQDQFAGRPLSSMLDPRSGGFEVYGGLLGGFVACLLYVRYQHVPFNVIGRIVDRLASLPMPTVVRRMVEGCRPAVHHPLPARLFADAAAPTMLLGMGIGRVGCFLFGCCWGGTCPNDLAWAIQFPFGSPPFMRQWEDRQVTAPAELVLMDKSGTASLLAGPLLKPSIPDFEKAIQRAEQGVKDAGQPIHRSGLRRVLFGARCLVKRPPTTEERIAAAENTRDITRWVAEPVLAHYAKFETTPEKLTRLVAPRYHSLSVHPSQIYGAIGPLLLAFLGNAWFYRRKHHGIIMPTLFMVYAVQRFIEEAIRSDNPHDTFGLTISQGVGVAVFVGSLLILLAILRMPPRAADVVPWYPPQGKPAKPVETVGCA